MGPVGVTEDARQELVLQDDNGKSTVDLRPPRAKAKAKEGLGVEYK